MSAGYGSTWQYVGLQWLDTWQHLGRVIYRPIYLTLPTFETFSRRPHALCAHGSAFPLIFASCATSLTALSHSAVMFTRCLLVDRPLTVEVIHLTIRCITRVRGIFRLTIDRFT